MSAHSDAGVERVWMYWEQRPDRPRAPYLDLCLETIGRHRGDLTVEAVDERTVFDWLPRLDRATWDRLPDAVRRSDYCRTRLLHDHGGLYLDADCIALAPLHELVDPLASASFVTYGTADGLVQNNLFAALPGADILGEWIEGQERLLSATADWSTLPRTALGEPLVTPVAARLPHFRFPERVIAPVMWYEWGRFFSRFTSPDRVLRHAPLTVMLYNEFMGPALRDTTVDDLRTGRTLLSRLFRIALGESTAHDEIDMATHLHLVPDLLYSTYGRAFMGRVRALETQFVPKGAR